MLWTHRCVKRKLPVKPRNNTNKDISISFALSTISPSTNDTYFSSGGWGSLRCHLSLGFYQIAKSKLITLTTGISNIFLKSKPSIFNLFQSFTKKQDIVSESMSQINLSIELMMILNLKSFKTLQINILYYGKLYAFVSNQNVNMKSEPPPPKKITGKKLHIHG